jgi:hypothetical protein
MDPTDMLAIQQLLALYGHVIDERWWSRMDEVFTDDVRYAAPDFDMPTVQGLDNLRRLWTSPDARHPLAHHATNIVITPGEDTSTAHVLSKGIGVGYRGRVGSVVYRDVVRRTAGGWRLAERTVALRRPDALPDPT